MPVGPNALLTVRQRADGRLRSFPITPLEHEGRRYVFSAFGESSWVADLRVAGEATLRQGRKQERLLAVELSSEEGAIVLRAALPAVLETPVFGPRVGRWYGLAPDSPPEEYLRAARVHPGFELRSL